MSPARPSATASSTRPAQRECRPRRMKSSSIRCMQTPLLNGFRAGTTNRGLLHRERELAVRERFGAPRLVQIGEMSGVEVALRADDDARHRLRKAQERAFALEDLGQDIP